MSALAATIHLALLGPQGLRERGEICLQRAHHLHAELCALAGVKPLVSGPFFSEFALALPCPAAHFATTMRALGVDPGVPLLRLGLEAGCAAPVGAAPTENVLLVAVTEENTPNALDQYVVAARAVLDLLPPALAS